MFIINVEEKQIITGKDDIKTEQGRKGIKHVRYRIWSSAKAGQKNSTRIQWQKENILIFRC